MSDFLQTQQQYVTSKTTWQLLAKRLLLNALVLAGMSLLTGVIEAINSGELKFGVVTQLVYIILTTFLDYINPKIPNRKI